MSIERYQIQTHTETGTFPVRKKGVRQTLFSLLQPTLNFFNEFTHTNASLENNDLLQSLLACAQELQSYCQKRKYLSFQLTFPITVCDLPEHLNNLIQKIDEIDAKLYFLPFQIVSIKSDNPNNPELLYPDYQLIRGRRDEGIPQTVTSTRLSLCDQHNLRYFWFLQTNDYAIAEMRVLPNDRLSQMDTPIKKTQSIFFG